MKVSALDTEEKLELVMRNTIETVTRKELQTILEIEREPRAYWGFESSGFMHIGLGLVCGSKIKNMIDAGFHFIIFLADWHSWINNKLGGKIEDIRLCGEYFKECFTALGVEKVEYLWAKDLAIDIEYWEKVVKIAKKSSLQRVQRALPIMGREMGQSNIETAWLFYPCMQATDIFHMRLDVACGGMDQRKAHMLAREAGAKLGWKKPACIHTPLLMGLKGPTESRRQLDEDNALNLEIVSKMAKSKPSTCIFVHDSPIEIRRKIKNAYCPPKQAICNPVLQQSHYAIFPNMKELTIKRARKYGGDTICSTYTELEEAYIKGEIHPLDLKNAVAEALIQILKPVRRHFKDHPDKLNRMKEIEITR